MIFDLCFDTKKTMSIWIIIKFSTNIFMYFPTHLDLSMIEFVTASSHLSINNFDRPDVPKPN